MELPLKIRSSDFVPRSDLELCSPITHRMASETLLFPHPLDEKNVPRPPHWSGWRLLPNEIEFWVDGEGRIHERLIYKNIKGKWKKEILYP